MISYDLTYLSYNRRRNYLIEIYAQTPTSPEKRKDWKGENIIVRLRKTYAEWIFIRVDVR